METPQWLMILASHLLQVTFLVAIVLLLTRWLLKDRPHIAHALWVLVLLKCLVPPTWSSPTSLFSWLGTALPVVEVASGEFDSKQKSDSGTSPKDQVEFTIKYEEAIASDRERSALTGQKERASIDNHESSIGSTSFWSVVTFSIVGTIVTGFIVGILMTSMKLRRFLHSVYAGGVRQSTNLDELTSRLSHELGVRQKIQVLLVANPVGPVVIGLFKPKLLLPEIIVGGKSPEQLAPLIAHELIHIRRGDLWWALLQTLATRLWWFHPWVQLAGNMLTRESERSCDEETVLSLGCAPSVYARSLLEVLERKLELEIAPALPGVRPVDITLNRMERIMKLGQGSHDRSPKWIWGLLLVGSVCLLPSAAIGVAQEESKGEKIYTERVVTEKLDQQNSELVYVPVPSDKESSASADGKFADYRIDVADLLQLLRSRNLSEAVAKKRLLEMLPLRTQAELAEVKSDLGLPGKTTINLPKPKIVGTELHLFETQIQFEQIKKGIQRLRDSGFRQVICQVNLITIALSDYEKLSKDWKELQLKPLSEAEIAAAKSPSNQSGKQFENLKVGEASLWLRSVEISIEEPKVTQGKGNFNPLRTITLSTQEREAFLQTEGLSNLSAPKLAVVNGQLATVATRSEKLRDVGPNTRVFQDTRVEVQPAVLENGSLELNFALGLAEDLFDSEVIEGEGTLLNSISLAVKQSLSSDQTLVVGGIPQVVDGKDCVLVACVGAVVKDMEFAQERERVLYEPSKEEGKNPLVSSEEAQRFEIQGPITAAPNSAAIDPPSKNEILTAIDKRLKELGREPLDRDMKLTIKLVKISDSVEPAKFVPLIGNAAFHKTSYECTITSEASSDLSETIYIDHVHYHMVE